MPPGLPVTPLQTGRVRIHASQVEPRSESRARVLQTIFDRRWTDWLPAWSWAIEHPDGLIVVDAGVIPDFRAPWWDVYHRVALQMDVPPEDHLLARLRAHGYDPADVRWHVATHLHIDHVGALGALPAAEVVLAKPEWDVATSSTGRLRGLILSDDARRRARPVTFTDAGSGPFPTVHRLTSDGAVTLLPTPGHSPGHMSVLVDERLLIVGDAVYSERQLRGGWIDGISPDPAAAHESIRRLQELCRRTPTVLLPTHEPAVPELLAEGRAAALT
jgi:glyoxylase-like metal-dependent hydrolase (beta-lactamase superfamily II)